MMNRQEIQATGKSLDSVLKKVAGQLGVPKEQVEYEVISKTDAGFLSFLGGSRVEIRAWAKAATRVQNSRGAARSDDQEQPISREPLSAEEQDKLIEDLREFCAGVCAYIVNREGINVSATIDGDRLSLDIEDDEMAQQIVKNTRLAESMEHLLRKKPRYLKRELPFRIFVDARGIRIKREVELVEMAQDLSAKVAENQKPVVLNYKSSYDRKIIHMALDKDDRVYTKSIGSGANRKLMILPSRPTQAADAGGFEQ